MSDYEQGTGGRAGIEQQRATSLTESSTRRYPSGAPADWSIRPMPIPRRQHNVSQQRQHGVLGSAQGDGLVVTPRLFEAAARYGVGRMLLQHFGCRIDATHKLIAFKALDWEAEG